MERELRTNVCNVSDLSTPNSHSDVQELVRLHIPSGLQYCCRSWAFHTWVARSHELDWGYSRGHCNGETREHMAPGEPVLDHDTPKDNLD